MKSQALCTALVLSLLLTAGAPAGATTFMMVRDEALADQAPLVVEGRLLARAPAAAGGAPANDYVFAVERVVKGAAVGGTVTVRVLGGRREDGLSLRIWGAPSFREGGRALLFLEPRPGGHYRVLHFTLGAFHVVEADGRPVALRDLSRTHEVTVRPEGVEAAPAAPDRARDLDGFARWIADRAAGLHRPADYFVELPQPTLRKLTEAFSLFEWDGLNMRWFNFAGGGGVSFRAHNSGQSGLAGGGFSQFQTALGAWNADPATVINYVYGGTTSADSGFEGGNDGVNAILFNDPNNELGSFDCDSGGVLALGGPWFNDDQTDPDATGVFNGVTYFRILEADIITNNGLGCFFAASPNAGKAAEELFAHEAGHTLGLGHSCDENGGTPEPSCASSAVLNQALMRWLIHDDGRGGALNNDDRAAINVLYGSGVNPPAAPTNLQATGVSTTQVGLSWQDKSNNETGFKVEARTFGGTFAEIGTVPANTTAATVSGLSSATIYEFRIRATNSAGDSAYSNVATASTFAVPAPCLADGDSLCLNADRFKVEAIWQTTSDFGQAQVVELTPDTGYLWFFSASNVEAVVKVLNACSFNNRFWVFAGGLTDVRVILTVTDTANGTVKTYENPQGKAFQPIQDTSAFATCP